MKVIIDFTLIPIGSGVSLSSYVAACQKVLAASGLKTQMHANGTGVEGEWDEVFAAVKKCHETVHQMGVVRISTVITAGTRTDRDQGMEGKIASVKAKLIDHTTERKSASLNK